MQPLIFLDLDGVCADFLSALASLYGRSLDDLPVGLYDLATMLNLSFERIDQDIARNSDFWLGIRPYPWAKRLTQELRRRGRVIVLSTAWPQSPCSHFCKVAWVEEFLGVPSSDVILTADKHLLAASNRFLLDDHEKNCTAWAACGGVAIKFPAYHSVGSNMPDDPAGWAIDALDCYLGCSAHVNRYDQQN